MASEASRLLRFVRALVRFQVRHPVWVMLFAVALTGPAVWLAKGLELKTGFEALLPDNKPSVKELARVGARTAGVATLSLVIDGKSDGKDKKVIQQFGDALLVELRSLGTEWVGTAESGVQAEQEFLRKRRALFAPLARLKSLSAKIEDRYDYEINGSLDDPPEAITRETIKRELSGEDPKSAKPGEKAVEKTDDSAGPPYLDGYYMDRAGSRLAILIRTPVATGDLPKIAELRKRVEAKVAAANPGALGLTVHYTGDIVTSAEQYGAVKDDLANVGLFGILLILGVDFLFFLRIRAVVSMAIAIGIGVLWTFGITRLAIGHLNTASGFLVSIVFGNGINFGILLRARYGESRRAGSDLETGLFEAYRDTWRPTLTAAMAASAGYVVLATMDFRGFKHFGAIGGYGMLLCWIANYLFMAPMLVIFEKFSPTFGPPKPGLWGRIVAFMDHGVPYGAPFAAVARRIPRTSAAIGLVLAVVGVILTVRYVKNDPLEYDTSKLGNSAVGNETPAAKLSEEVDQLVGRSGQDGMAIMVDRIDQVKPLKAVLEARRAAAPPDKLPFQKVVTIFELIPEDQAEKLALIQQMRKRIDRVRELGKISDEDWKTLEPELPPKDISTLDVPDLPERVARPFTEKDGTRGRIVYIVPSDGRSVRDIHYLLQWADSFRETKLPSGETIVGSGRAVIFADMLSAVIEESPKAIVLSFASVSLVVFLAFIKGNRGFSNALLVIASLVIGVAWMGAWLALAKVKINFLNFIAVPITFGIGVDYAVNVVHRFQIEPPGRVVQIVRETGGAVVLCSLTTTLGYLALLMSINGAVRSFGMAAVIGEVTCILSALVILPGILTLIDRRRIARAPAQPSPATATAIDG